MATLDDIRRPVMAELATFEQQMAQALTSPQPELDEVLKYIGQARGKRLRPLLVLLCARLFGGVTDQSYRAAVLIELFHTASLVHDDVVDAADRRRNQLAVHVAWSPKVAVLLGDFLLARALHLAVSSSEFALMQEAAEVVMTMSQGEVLQLEKTATLDMNEAEYERVIEAKTAALLSMCTAWGARSAGASDRDVARMRRFGHALGMAFQIRDDLFDLQPPCTSGQIGKPAGNDLREKKLTLPLIDALRRADDTERRVWLQLLERGEELTDGEVARVAAFAESHGGIAYAVRRMEAWSQEAADILAEDADRPGADALRQLLQYIIHRSH